MSHELEFVNGVAQMAYAGEKPWHGLGHEVHNDLTARQIAEKAGIDWGVYKQPAFVKIGGKEVRLEDKCALVRDRDGKILDTVTDSWNPVQNEEAIEFMQEFVMEGRMKMETAGSLKGGRYIWMLAKVDESFEAVKGDQVDSYLLFTIPHKYGSATDVRFTPIRVVCWNTLSMSLEGRNDLRISMDHRKEFDPEIVKTTLNLAHKKLDDFSEAAQFLTTKRYVAADLVDYFDEVFPFNGDDSEVPEGMRIISRAARRAVEVMDSQPGAQYGEGSWWQAFNAVTYLTDHELGKNADQRLTSSWYGEYRNRKNKALKLALDYAA